MEIGTRWFKSNTTMYIAPLLPIIKDKIKGDIAKDMEKQQQKVYKFISDIGG